MDPLTILGGLTGVGTFINDLITGQQSIELQKQNLKQSKDQQAFNEQYSMQSLAEQARQFELNNATANRNIDFQKQIAEQNLAFQQDAFNRQLQENELTRQREDTAYQRQIADLKNAGLSPLMASNGANAATMSVGSAPQYDAQAVSTAQGSAIQLAQEYASLMNMAKGQYLTRRQEATNQMIAARMTLSQLFEQRRVNGQNLALQSMNLATNIKDMRKKHELIDEQIESTKKLREWNEEHEYGKTNWVTLLMPTIKKISEKIHLDSDSIASAISNGYNKVSETIKSILDNSVDRNELPTTTQELTKNLSDGELEEVGLLIALNPHLSQEQIYTVANTLYPKLDSKRKSTTDFNQFVAWIQRDGLSQVLSIAFGIK